MKRIDTRRLSPGRYLRNMPIGRRLSFSFALLVAVPLVVMTLTLWAGYEATEIIQHTNESRLPSALAATQARVSLYRMMTDLRSFLVLGDPQFIRNYRTSEDDFRKDLESLHASRDLDPTNRARLAEIQGLFDRYLAYPDRLFALQGDQMDREPAYALLNTRGTELGGDVLLNTNRLIDALARKAPSERRNGLLRDVARFQGSFAAMFSGLRGYVTTGNSLFRFYEFENNLAINNEVWNGLIAQQEALDAEERMLLNAINTSRSAFLAEVPERAFSIMQSPQRRLDLDLFGTEVVPLTDSMLQQLREVTESQLQMLEQDLTYGGARLEQARLLTLLGAVMAVVLGGAMALLFTRNVVGPVRRLTSVAEQIRGGDLAALAAIESRDEIGTLAMTFNKMTGQLRHTLLRVREEKKRADDLLEVVIPIGVALSAEKDFDRLLESILLEAKSFCNADVGMLYLRTDDNQLRYVIVRNDALQIALGGTTRQPIPYPPLPLYDPNTGEPNHRNVAAHAALTGTSINIPDATQITEFDIARPEGYNENTGFASLLTIPLRTNQRQVVGVLQLLDPKDRETGRIVPFDVNLQQMMESFSSLAVAALEAYIREQSLRKEIRQLRIEIDQVKRQQQVSAIVESDFFQNLRSKARAMRQRNQAAEEEASGRQDEPPSEESDETAGPDEVADINHSGARP